MSVRLAFDLGSRELKILEAEERHLSKHSELLLPDGWLVDGTPTPLLSEAIRHVVAEGGFRSRTVRVAISEAGTAFRDFSLPPMLESELSSAVLFEGRRLIPMPPEDVYFAWHAAAVGSGFAIFLVAARRVMIDAVVGAFTAAGLRVERIDLKPLALARGMGIADGLLLDWGAGEATVVLMAQGRPRFFRTFQLDSPPEDVEAQLDELAFSLDALVKFMRGAAQDVPLGASTALAVGGRFAFIPDGLAVAAERFPFKVLKPVMRVQAAGDFPWQAHFAGIGLLLDEVWQKRLAPSQAGDNRVAA